MCLIVLRRGRCGHHRMVVKSRNYLCNKYISVGTPVSSSNKTYRHDITEMLLKAALTTMILIQTLCMGFSGPSLLFILCWSEWLSGNVSRVRTMLLNLFLWLSYRLLWIWGPVFLSLIVFYYFSFLSTHLILQGSNHCSLVPDCLLRLYKMCMFFVFGVFSAAGVTSIYVSPSS